MEIVFFIITAAIALVGAVAMLLSRNAVHSALFLLLNFGAISVLFLLLHAPFLFVVQLIVYAGAIIVLFLFVVMLLGAENDEAGTDVLGWQRYLAIGLAAVLLIEAAVIGVSQIGKLPIPVDIDDMFATPEKIGAALFSRYLFPFEITSFILLAAIIGVIALSRQTQPRGQ